MLPTFGSSNLLHLAKFNQLKNTKMKNLYDYEADLARYEDEAYWYEKFINQK